MTMFLILLQRRGLNLEDVAYTRVFGDFVLNFYIREYAEGTRGILLDERWKGKLLRSGQIGMVYPSEDSIYVSFEEAEKTIKEVISAWELEFEGLTLYSSMVLMGAHYGDADYLDEMLASCGIEGESIYEHIFNSFKIYSKEQVDLPEIWEEW